MTEVFHINLPLTLGQKARISRIARDLTQYELSALAGTTQAQVSALERDLFVYPAARKRILSYLSVTVSEVRNDC